MPKTPFQVQFLFPDLEQTFHSHTIFHLKVKFLPLQEKENLILTFKSYSYQWPKETLWQYLNRK